MATCIFLTYNSEPSTLPCLHPQVSLLQKKKPPHHFSLQDGS